VERVNASDLKAREARRLAPPLDISPRGAKAYADQHFPFRPELAAPAAIRCSIAVDGSLEARFQVHLYPLTPQLIWRRAYDKDRYCEYLTQRELNERFRDIVVNMFALTAEAKISFVESGPGGEYWQKKLAEVVEELQLRYGPFPNGLTPGLMKPPTVPDFASDLAKKAAKVAKTRPGSTGTMLVRYGKPEHIRDLYLRGRFLAQPATTYSDTDFSSAVRDDERALKVSVAVRRGAILKLAQNPQDMPAEFKGQRMDFEITHPGNFWMFCMSAAADPRLFVDFPATACLIIKDRAEFVRRVLASTSKYLPNAVPRYGMVSYIDPVLPKTPRIDIRMSKHFKYAYQNEFRFVWASADVDPKPTFVEIGDLQDISEMIEL